MVKYWSLKPHNTFGIWAKGKFSDKTLEYHVLALPTKKKYEIKNYDRKWRKTCKNNLLEQTWSLEQKIENI